MRKTNVSVETVQQLHNSDDIPKICIRLILVSLIYVMISGSASAQLRVSVKSTNKIQVGLYEKIEIVATIEDAAFTNPYDPDQIDLRARFVSPAGKQWEILGFYDNYQNRNQWKIRFSPDEIGDWRFLLTVKDSTGSTASHEHTFTAVGSAYHGWLRVSTKNPHYFQYDDGRSFYGIGPYYPWGVHNGTEGLERLEESGANFWGYWNIMYGNEGNIIESTASGLGRYDQPKCGRIDQLIEWSEARGLKMMLAIWPHDLISKTVWAHQWHQNPYNSVTSVEQFYESDTAWEFQKKQYRYLIARWGYSRALGVWEIINEINGTDGWVNGNQAEATLWVKKVHDYLKANDPFQHPTTASMSGGHFWSDGYTHVDIPNVHLYERDWTAPYGGNPLRSSLWVYQSVTRQLWNNFSKPAIMGEAGAQSTFGNFSAGSEEYKTVFHDALWGCWANGLAATPVWWSFTNRRWMTNDIMEQMAFFSKVAVEIDYQQMDLIHGDISVPDCDAYLMKSDNLLFGWFREHFGNDVSAEPLQIFDVKDTVYRIIYYDTWRGEQIAVHTRPAVNGKLFDIIPGSDHPLSDLAIVIQPAQIGSVPSRLELLSSALHLLSDGRDRIELTCLLVDDQDRFCYQAANPVTFSLNGPGRFEGETTQNARNGRAVIYLEADSSVGTAQIIVSSPNLIADTLNIEISKKFEIDDFEDYGSIASLEASWRVRSGTSVQVALDRSNPGEGQQSLRMDYAIGNGNPPYAGISKQIRILTDAFHYFQFWLQPDGSNRDLAILLFETSGRYWQATVKLAGTDPRNWTIPFSDFNASDGTRQFSLKNISEISFNIVKAEGEYGQGYINLDDLALVTSITTAVSETVKSSQTTHFRLSQNYPNPFNDSTIIHYYLPEWSHVTVSIFNTNGQLIEKLVDSRQKPGSYSVQWLARGNSSGLYFYQIKTENINAVEKCVLIR